MRIGLPLETVAGEARVAASITDEAYFAAGCDQRCVPMLMTAVGRGASATNI